jgi:GNAT superfamily N-acetyltransferase
MKIELSSGLTNKQIEQIDTIWNEVYPIKLVGRFRLLIKETEELEHHILVNEVEDVIGWAATFLRDDEAWFSILVSASNQNKGFGQLLLDSLKENSKKLSGWVIDHNYDFKRDGSTYYSPLYFYLKNDFVLLQERLESDLISAAKITFG